MATVRQSGGDYSSLNAALAAAEATITIDETWTADDTTAASFTADATITVSGGAKHPGYWDESLNHYRLVSSSGHALTLNGAYTTTIDGIAIEQSGTTSSDECFRCVPGTSDTVTIKNSLLYCSTDTASQDCIYTGFTTAAGDITAEQCMFWGAGRGGINSENGDQVSIKINSCIFWDNGNTSEGGGILVNNPNVNQGWNIHNTIAVGNDGHASSEDYHSYGTGAPGTGAWNISHSIDSDNSIANVQDTGTGTLASRTATDNTSPGAGDWVIFEDITSAPYDLRVVSNDENDAEDMHSTATAHGLTIPTTDIVGTTRATAYECGAFTLVVGGVPANRAKFLPLLGVA